MLDELSNCQPLVPNEEVILGEGYDTLVDEEVEKEFQEQAELLENEEEPSKKARRKRRTLVAPEELLEEVIPIVQLLSGIRYDSSGNGYRIALVNGVVQRFTADPNKKYKFI